jgi:hypothetical protein
MVNRDLINRSEEYLKLCEMILAEKTTKNILKKLRYFAKSLKYTYTHSLNKKFLKLYFKTKSDVKDMTFLFSYEYGLKQTLLIIDHGNDYTKYGAEIGFTS